MDTLLAASPSQWKGVRGMKQLRRCRLDEITEAIELCKRQLNGLQHLGPLHPEVLAKSQELDKLLNLYVKHKKPISK